jgi:hypothetical protein
MGLLIVVLVLTGVGYHFGGFIGAMLMLILLSLIEI